MPKAVEFTAILTAAWLAGTGAAFAFQEVPTPPAEEPLSIPGANSAEQAPDLTFDSPVSPSAPKADTRKGWGLGNLDLLPKLNFGLELLYSNPKSGSALSAAPEQAPSTSNPSDDVKILGTVKRRF